jgi:hypothetical protein
LLQLLFVVEIQNCRDACLMGGGNMQSVWRGEIWWRWSRRQVGLRTIVTSETLKVKMSFIDLCQFKSRSAASEMWMRMPSHNHDNNPSTPDPWSCHCHNIVGGTMSGVRAKCRRGVGRALSEAVCRIFDIDFVVVNS